MSQIRPQDTVESALALARPGGECVVIADETSTANLRWAGNTLTTNGVAASRSLTVIAIDRRPDGTAGVGVVSRSGVGPDQVEDVVREAEKAAGQASAAEDAAALVPGDTPVRSGWEDSPAATDFGVFRGFAAELGETLRAAQAAGRKLYGFAEHGVTSTFLGTSAGLRLRHDQPEGRLELNAKSADMSRSAWAGAATRDFTDVDLAGLDAGLTQRLSWQARRVELPAGRYETLLPPTAAADLMIYMYWSAGARDAAEGRTVFSKAGGGTRVGERLAALPVDLFSDPAYPGLECAPFVVAHASGRDSSVFDNGLPAGRAPWVSAGELSALHSSRHSAALAGLPVTPALGNLIMSAGASGSLESMIASTRRGLLLTCLWYIREVDPQTLLLTGLTRDGVYLVEDGEVTGTVNNFRFNESPVGMLSRLAEAGRTEPTLPREWGDYFTRAAMPPLRVEGFNMSSVSQASLPVVAGSARQRYRGGMRIGHAGRGQQVHLVTQARRPMSEDIRYRQNRYLLMMGIRVLCFIAALLMFVNHLGWLAGIPAVGAIIIPYFAVVFANGGREPDNVRGFMEYRSNLPDRRESSGSAKDGDGSSPGQP